MGNLVATLVQMRVATMIGRSLRPRKQNLGPWKFIVSANSCQKAGPMDIYQVSPRYGEADSETCEPKGVPTMLLSRTLFSKFRKRQGKKAGNATVRKNRLSLTLECLEDRTLMSAASFAM